MNSDFVDRVRAALPSYEVGEEIARGGFGVVLFGNHRRLQRKVAIKLLPSEIAHDEDIRRRFAAEARLMAAMDHPHIVPVYDYVEDEDLCLFVMEYLPSGTVLERFTSGGFHPGPAIGVALACASALEAAHRQGVLHRDVKPANLMFAANGTVKLSDFGIAKIVGGDGGKTRAGDVLGTAYYIAPEQVLGHPVSPATDVYALATTLYQLLSGTLPFPMDVDSTALYMLHAYSRPTPLSKVAPTVPQPIADVVMRGLTTDPRQRWRTAQDFGVALASATTRSWGPNWLAQAGVPVLGNPSITAATAAISSPQVARVDSYSTPPPPPKSFQDNAVTPEGVASPRVPYIVAGVLAVLAIVVALIGLGAPLRGGDVAAGTVTIAGTDPAQPGDVRIDMTRPIDVTVKGIEGDTVSLTQSVLGINIASTEAPLDADGGTFVAEVDPPNPYIFGGLTTGELRVTDEGRTTASLRFGMESTQSAAITAFAGAVAFIALFAVAYIESYTRMLRRGKIDMSARVGLPIAAAALAVAMVGAVWIAIGREPTPATVVVCGLIGVAAGVSATIAAARHGAVNRRLRARQDSRPGRPGGPKSDGRSQPPAGSDGHVTPASTPPGAADSGTSAGRRRIKGLKIQRD